MDRNITAMVNRENYMDPAKAGRLQIQFNFGAQCQTFWRGKEDRLATDQLPA
jgi:hypothetical protein